MPKKCSKKKARASEPDSNVDIISKTEIKFEDTEDITWADPEFK